MAAMTPRGCAAVVSVVLVAVALGPLAFQSSAGPEDDPAPNGDGVTMLQMSTTTEKLGASPAAPVGPRAAAPEPTLSSGPAVHHAKMTLHQMLTQVAEKPEEKLKEWFRDWTTFSKSKEALIKALGNGALSAALVMIFAALYKCTRVPPTGPGEITSIGTWEYGICECRDLDPFVCVMSVCCLPIRWSETMSLEKMKAPRDLSWGFWPALLVNVLLLYVLSYVTVGLSFLLLLVLQVYYRQKVREAFSLEPNQHLFLDCLTWFFCSCCAACQEAKQVERVQRNDSKEES